MSGFKSFCDPVELDIGSGLTGIVGPNGCGKSNIVEALRWVMGESSARGLRGSEMNDVIFAGSSLRSAYDMAEVSVLVKKPATGNGAGGVDHGGGANGKGGGLAEAGVPFDLEELEIARRISRGTGSAYRINGREARARDIHLVFADAGAGARSPAIIGQGQVGFVVEAKPEERRRLLEDGAGIGGLHSRRREAELKLAATERNLERVTDRIADQEERLTDLRRQSKQAERYRKLQEQIRELESLSSLARLRKAAAALDGAKARLEAARRAHGAARETRERCEKAHLAAGALLPERREAVAVTTALAARAEERLVTIEAGHRQHERESGMLREQVEEATARLEGLDREAALAEATLAERRREAGEAQVRIGELEAKLAELRTAEPGLVEAAAMAGDHARRIEREIAVAESRRESLGKRLEELRTRRRTVAEELERLVSVDDDALVEVARRQLGEAEAERASAGEALERAGAEAALFAERRGECESRVEAIREKLAEAVAARQSLEAGIAAARQRRETLSAQIERLTREEQRIRRRLDAIAGERRALDLAGREAALAELAPRCEALDAELKDLQAREAGLAAAREEAAARREADLAATADIERRLDRAVAEEEALRSLRTAGDDGSPIIDRFEVPEAWSRALAAALGDDLLLRAEEDEGGGGFWRRLDGECAVLALPDGVEPLSARIRAPDRLNRRLASVGICADAAMASNLQHGLHQGQRLVTPEGGLWRWDGLVRLPDEEDESELRLLQHRRLAALAGEIPATRRALVEAQARAAESRELLGEAERELANMRSLHRRTEMECRSAAMELGQLETSIEAARTTETRLADEERMLASELSGVSRERSGMSLDDAAEPEALDARFREVENDVRALEREFAEWRERKIRADAGYEAARQRADGERQREARLLEAVTQAQIMFERRCGEAEVRKAHRSSASTGLNEDAARLDRETGELDGELASLDAELAAMRLEASERSGTLAEESAHLEELRKAASATAASLSALAERHGSLVAECERLSVAGESARDTMGPLAERLGQLRQRLDEHLRDTGQASRRDELAREVAQLRTRLAEERQVLAAAETALAESAGEARRAEGEAASRHEVMALAEAEHGRLEEAVAAALAHARGRLSRPVEELLADEEVVEALTGTDPSEMEEQLQRLVASRERIGPVNLRAAVEADEREAELDGLKREEEDLRQAVERLKSGISTLNREARERLREVFVRVDDHFRRLFAKLFNGGKAHLRLTNLDDPLACGLELDAMPPGKKLQNISLLSGGEKSLTALALIFAFFLSEPSPLCVLDEVDAALDDANVERFVLLMEEIARETNTRFVVVTHHPFTMARMDRLFGVTMVERGVSRLVSVALEEAVEMAVSA